MAAQPGKGLQRMPTTATSCPARNFHTRSPGRRPGRASSRYRSGVRAHSASSQRSAVRCRYGGCGRPPSLRPGRDSGGGRTAGPYHSHGHSRRPCFGGAPASGAPSPTAAPGECCTALPQQHTAAAVCRPGMRPLRCRAFGACHSAGRHGGGNAHDGAARQGAGRGRDAQPGRRAGGSGLLTSAAATTGGVVGGADGCHPPASSAGGLATSHGSRPAAPRDAHSDSHPATQPAAPRTGPGLPQPLARPPSQLRPDTAAPSATLRPAGPHTTGRRQDRAVAWWHLAQPQPRPDISQAYRRPRPG
jgi:hypothetical protein